MFPFVGVDRNLWPTVFYSRHRADTDVNLIKKGEGECWVANEVCHEWI